MAIIALEGMRFFAHHGYYEEEQIVGGHFTLDVYVDADIESAATMDELYTDADEDADEDQQPLSVNYETVYLLCKQVMKEPTKLLETVAQNLADKIEGYFENTNGVKVRLKKVQPPLPGKVDWAYVELGTGSFGPKLQLPKLKF